MIWPINIITTWWKLRKIREEDPYIYEDDAMFDEDNDYEDLSEGK